MRHPVSTPGCVESERGAVARGIVGATIDPHAPQNSGPSTRQDANGVWVIASAGAGSGVYTGGPWRSVTRIVGEASEGVALGAVATIARAGGLDEVGMNGPQAQASVDQRVDDEARRTFNRNGQWRRRGHPAAQAGEQLAQTGSVVGNGEAIKYRAAIVDDAHCVIVRCSVQSYETIHGQPPASWSKTCTAASPCGSLIDRRAGSHTLALHPVARLGLAAPRALRVSYGPSRGERSRQSTRGRASRATTATPRCGRVNLQVTQ